MDGSTLQKSCRPMPLIAWQRHLAMVIYPILSEGTVEIASFEFSIDADAYGHFIATSPTQPKLHRWVLAFGSLTVSRICNCSAMSLRETLEGGYQHLH